MSFGAQPLRSYCLIILTSALICATHIAGYVPKEAARRGAERIHNRPLIQATEHWTNVPRGPLTTAASSIQPARSLLASSAPPTSISGDPSAPTTISGGPSDPSAPTVSGGPSALSSPPPISRPPLPPSSSPHQASPPPPTAEPSPPPKGLLPPPPESPGLPPKSTSPPPKSPPPPSSPPQSPKAPISPPPPPPPPGPYQETPSSPVDQFAQVQCDGPSAGGLDNQNVSIPVRGSLLFRIQGNTCAVLPRIPSFLNPGTRYDVQVYGRRTADGTPEVNTSILAALLPSGVKITIPISSGQQSGDVAVTSSTGSGRRLHGTSEAFHDDILPSRPHRSSHPLQPRKYHSRRGLQQSGDQTPYTIILTATRCNGTPVADATDVTADLAYSLRGATIGLTQSSSGSNIYTGTVNLDTALGNNYTYAVSVTVPFCNAAQAQIQQVCRNTGADSVTAAEDLTGSCQTFLANQQDAEPTVQVTRACTLIGVSLQTLCTSTRGLSCDAVTQKNFEITVAGSARIPGASPNPFRATNSGAVIYQGTVNGQSGQYSVPITLEVPPGNGGCSIPPSPGAGSSTSPPIATGG
ncbi:hypothetical protein WJX73_001508 [Symbiochloris irregularis]|uniref:Uncharacterized protein n=1 Tax=Symbiochloris irregularis TaxID=706552 RepID=A0AAW1NZZ1_9CHLO